MEVYEPGTITRLLHEVGAGNPQAHGRLFSLVYEELRRIARQRIARVRETGPQALRPTELVHEAYIRLFGGGPMDWKNRQHFYGAAADAMLHLLLDALRKRRRPKHGAGRLNPLSGEVAGVAENPVRLLELEDALRRLERAHGAAAAVVKCKYILGMTEDEIAEALAVSRKTVHNRWRYAQAWLKQTLGPGAGHGH